MKIENVRYVNNQGYPELWMDIDGRIAKIHCYQKSTLVNAGFVSLGSKWKDLMPEFDYKGTPLRGFTNNPEVVRLYKKFKRDLLEMSLEDFQKLEVISYPKTSSR